VAAASSAADTPLLARLRHDVGEAVGDVVVDALLLSVDDGARMLERTGGVLTADVARLALNTWWD
jgi:hypothetical protein